MGLAILDAQLYSVAIVRETPTGNMVQIAPDVAVSRSNSSLITIIVRAGRARER